MNQDFADHGGVQNSRNNLEFATACAMAGVDSEGAGQQLGPGHFPFFRSGCFKRSWIGKAGVRGRFGFLFFGDNSGSDFSVRGEAAKKSREVDPGLRH